MSAKTVTDGDATAREAVLLAMQMAAEQVEGKKGVTKGPKGTKGIVVLSKGDAGSSPKDKKKPSGSDAEDEEDERSESSSVKPRHFSFSGGGAYNGTHQRKVLSRRARKVMLPGLPMNRMMKRGKKKMMMMMMRVVAVVPKRTSACTSIIPSSMIGSRSGPWSLASPEQVPWECSTPYAWMKLWMDG